MKKSSIYDLFRVSLILAGAVLLAGTVLFGGQPAQAQDDDKKVIQKTTDKDGFEKQLTEVDLRHQTAMQLMSAGQWQEAALELESVVASEADRIEGWQDLAKCYNNLKQYEKAAAAYVQAVGLSPENLDLMSNLGFAQLNAGQMESAIATYEKMLTVDPLSYDANVHLGFVYQKEDDKAKAIAYYEKALEGREDDITTMGSLAQLYSDNKELDKSIAMYERAIDAADDARKTKLRTKLGSSLISAKQWEKAALVFGALVEADAENAAHQFNLGISLAQSNNHTEAAPHLQKVIELRPDYVQAYQQLAASYNELGRYEAAIATIRKAIPIATNKAGLYCTWGRSLEKQTLYDEATDKFRLAVDDPQWGAYAKKQIKRQEQLKKRAKAIAEQG